MTDATLPILERTPERRDDAVRTDAPSRAQAVRAVVTSRWTVRAILSIVVLLVGYRAWGAGLAARQFAFEYTAPIRFHGDIDNSWHWGSRVLGDAHRAARTHGNEPVTWPQYFSAYFHLYDIVAAGPEKMNPDDPPYGLDYSPARLLIMTSWVKHTIDLHPRAAGADDEFLQPMLNFNTGIIAAASVFMFLLVLVWRKRGVSGDVLSVSLALVAALVMWLNPSNLVDGHSWPQWDIWPIPFFLLAMLLVSFDWFFTAGAVIAAGALFKGQTMLVVPIFIVWPLLQLRFGAAFRAGSGFALAFLGLNCVWLLGAVDGNIDGFFWIAGVVCVTLVFCLWRRQFALRWPWMAAVLVAGAVIAWPWMRAMEPGTPFGEASPLAWKIVAEWKWVFLAVACGPLLALAVRWLPRRATPFACAAVAGICLFVAAPVFGGSWAWYRIGFEHPQVQYPSMVHGPCYNLADILEQNYHWSSRDRVSTAFDETQQDPRRRRGGFWSRITGLDGGGNGNGRPQNNAANSAPAQLEKPWLMRDLMVWSYGVTLALCCVGAAIHSRRKDPRLLIALVAPWLLFFALLPQMHQRYLVWAGALCGVSLACSVGLGLLHLLLSLASTSMMLVTMFSQFDPDVARSPKVINAVTVNQWSEWLRPLDPGFSWAVLLIAAIYLYYAVVPRRRSNVEPPTRESPLAHFGGSGFEVVMSGRAVK